MTQRERDLEYFREIESDGDRDPKFAGAFGLTQAAVDRLRQVIAQESDEVLSQTEAWQRAIEVISFANVLLESLPPKNRTP